MGSAGATKPVVAAKLRERRFTLDKQPESAYRAPDGWEYYYDAKSPELNGLKCLREKCTAAEADELEQEELVRIRW